MAEHDIEHARAILDAVGYKGDRAQLLSLVDPTAPLALVSSPFWRCLAAETGNPSVGLDAGQRVDLRFLGPVFYLAGCARDLTHTVELIGPLLEGVGVHVAITGDVFTFDFDLGPMAAEDRIPSQQHTVDFIMAVSFRFLQTLLPSARIASLTARSLEPLAHEAVAERETYFNCSYRGVPNAAHAYEVTLSRGVGQMPLPGRDDVLSALLAQAAPTYQPVSEYRRLERVYREALLAGDDSLEAVATRLGISARQLGRVLTAAGTTHRGLQEVVRLQRALEGVVDEEVPLSEAGRRAGFLDPTGFSRAFRRWTGRAPSAFRALFGG